MIPGEEEIRDIVYGWMKEGKERRLNGTLPKFHPSSFRGMIDIAGWVSCDLQLALCRSDPVYRANQKSFNPQLFDKDGNVRK